VDIQQKEKTMPDLAHDHPFRINAARASECHEMATNVMRDREIVCGGERFEIVEVEFYMDADPHTHRAPRQISTHGALYFHRASAKPGAAYRGGSFKGIDVTFGDGAAYAGGMLIRAMRSYDSGTSCNGPCNVAKALHQKCANEFPEWAEFASAAEAASPFEPHAPIQLARAPRALDGGISVTAGPRIGLSAKGDDPGDAFRFAPLRFYLTRPGYSIHKGATYHTYCSLLMGLPVMAAAGISSESLATRCREKLDKNLEDNAAGTVFSWFNRHCENTDLIVALI
jgi:hypothetical protein